MKSLKKLLSIFAAFMMVVGLTAVNVSAANATITIEDAIVGKTYKAYKIFDATYGQGTAVAYTVTQEQRDFLEKLGTEKAPIPFKFVGAEGDIYSVQLSDELTKEEVTQAQQQKAVSQFFKNNQEAIINAKNSNNNSLFGLGGEAKAVEGQTTTISVQNAPGYYFVTSTGGSVVMLDSVNSSATIQEKNEGQGTKVLTTPSTDKYLQLGDEVSYTVGFTVYPGTLAYEFKDVMTGLTLKDGSINVYEATYTNGVYTPNKEKELTVSKDYTVKTNDITNQPTAGPKQTSFSILLTEAELLTIPSDGQKYYAVTYTATVNEDAYTGTVNNQAIFKPGNTTDDDAKKEEVKSYNFKLTINKTAETANGTALEGAKFKLFKNAVTDKDNKVTSVGDQVKFVVVDEKANAYRVATTKDQAEGSTVKVVETITTNQSGQVSIAGLDHDIQYALQEVEAPAGYNLLEGYQLVTNPDKATDSTTAVLVTENTVINKSGSTLPSTGGMGTTMLYVAGAILMVGAAVIFVTNKRMKHE
ncbi:SpaH/EbpB family LPXTG-anchored major pilin [uncultured Dubosiella sp.]|uniref:SpaH/EbpB family LPXTG-anchored major pilin n=1 Tax=uncultured Dubosiella sp. TaxID=1937011 RepID=UPI0025B29EA4|nr:SpaH/EbpB family LPXTG-anchored major pilin [uncultured Dubosiella sp.]